MRIVPPSFEIVDEIDGEEILRRIERAGRTAYKSEAKITPGSAREFVARIIRLGHESVIEHEKVSVRIVCDRGVSHEIVRHRLASYTQESTRYCDYGKAGEIQVIEPPKLTEAQRILWRTAMERAEEAYNEMRKAGAPPQIARSVLPNSLKTEIVMTANLREWRHFFKMRASLAAHPQMQELAYPMLREFARKIPVVFDDLLAERQVKLTTSFGIWDRLREVDIQKS